MEQTPRGKRCPQLDRVYFTDPQARTGGMRGTPRPRARGRRAQPADGGTWPGCPRQGQSQSSRQEQGLQRQEGEGWQGLRSRAWGRRGEGSCGWSWGTGPHRAQWPFRGFSASPANSKPGGGCVAGGGRAGASNKAGLSCCLKLESTVSHECLAKGTLFTAIKIPGG